MFPRSTKQQELLNLPSYLQLRNGVFAKEALPVNLKFYFSPGGNDKTVATANPDFEKLVLQLGSCLSDTPSQGGTCYWVVCIRSTNSARKGNLVISVENGQFCFATKQPIEKGNELLIFYMEAFAMASQMPRRPDGAPRPLGRLPLYLAKDTQMCCFCHSFGSSTTSSWPKYCDLCHANLFSELNLRLHIAKEHQFFFRAQSVLPWSCHLCSLNFSLARELSSHLTLHSVEGSFQRAVEQHGLDRNGKKNVIPCNHPSCQSCPCRGRYRCPLCSKFLAEMQQMTDHFRSHGPRRPRACKVCKQPLGHADDAKLHFEMKHKTVDGIYNCSSCQKSYATRARLEGHVRYAHPEFLLKCAVCKRSFTRSDKLKRHLQTHLATAAHSCTQCKRSFKRKDNLKAHCLRMHQKWKSEPICSPPQNLNEYIYKCMECAKGFKRRGMLICHLKQKHPDKDIRNVPELNMPLLRFSYLFPCEYCAQQFSSTKKRLIHVQREHPSYCQPNVNLRQQLASAYIFWPVQCPACPQQYARKASLKKHVTKQHPDLLSDCPGSGQTALTGDDEIEVPGQATFVAGDFAWQSRLRPGDYCKAFPLPESHSQF